MMLKIPITKEEMVKAVVETVRKNKMKDCYVRFVVSRGVGDLGLDPRKCPKPTVIIIADNIKIKAGNAKEEALPPCFTWVRRNPVDGTSHEVKSLNYLNSIMAKIEANMRRRRSHLPRHQTAAIAEGVGENIFIVKNGKILTPPTSHRRI